MSNITDKRIIDMLVAHSNHKQTVESRFGVGPIEYEVISHGRAIEFARKLLAEAETQERIVRYTVDEIEAMRASKKETPDLYFTVVFRGDLRKIVGNPHKLETPFGQVEMISLGNALADADEEETCPVCDEPLKVDDTCATDIELGICHAECLAGAPVVDLDTGEPTGGEMHTYRYGDLDTPALVDLLVGDNQPRYTTKRMYDEVAKAKAFARCEALEEAAALVESHIDAATAIRDRAKAAMKDLK